jgi:glutaredoxin
VRRGPQPGNKMRVTAVPGVMNRVMNRSYATSIFLGVILLACGTEQPQKEPSASASTGPVPVVTDDRTDLVFTWVADGGPRIASSVADVPSEVKRSVRVQDPSIPPEKRDTSVMYLADLTQPGGNGQYPVKAVQRSEYEAKRRAQEEARKKAEAAAVAASPPPGGPAASAPAVIPPQAGQPPVIMYATRHCPVCVKARRWLLEQTIPYVEKDVERDAQAAQSLAQKGAAQGVSTRGVPMFEIGGKLLPGFDKGQILAALRGVGKVQR